MCGTDREVINGHIPSHIGLPRGAEYIVVGHEAVGRVAEVGPAVQGLRVGDLVVPTVRRGCGGCPACTVGQADLCYTGQVRERGIVGLHGFLAEQIVEREEHLVPVPPELEAVAPLVESLTTPEKALRRIRNARAHLPEPAITRALVTGSGPIALLAVMALRLRDIPTWALARQPASGLPAEIVRAAGAAYVQLDQVDLDDPRAALGGFDAVVEATGAVELSVAMLGALAPNGVLDLVGGPPERKAVPIHASALGMMVGRNLTMLGSVNANRADWVHAVDDLLAMRQRFGVAVDRLITHTFAPTDVDVAFVRTPGQIKAVVDLRA
ncbi:MAG: alcohol dehydrogenase catalytic domain-containing protein [Chloroflexi bacterium]|nr:alcohol dehydrogenase catalytic domain-containing protein [Chloroflexota bacterium]